MKLHRKFVKLQYSLQSRLTAVTRGMRRKELTNEKKCPAAIKGRKKDYWTSKSVAYARVTKESRSQSQSHGSRSTLSAVLEDTKPPYRGCNVDFFLSRHLGSRRGRCDRSQVADCSGALRAIMEPLQRSREWDLQMRDRVFLQRRMAVVAILFPNVLTAHALFHMNEDPIRVLMLNPPQSDEKKNEIEKRSCSGVL